MTFEKNTPHFRMVFSLQLRKMEAPERDIGRPRYNPLLVAARVFEFHCFLAGFFVKISEKLNQKNLTRFLGADIVLVGDGVFCDENAMYLI